MIFVKLQNGAYVVVREDYYENSYYSFLVGMVALRSPKNTLVITGNEDPSFLLFNLEEKKLHFDKIAIALGRSLNDTQKRRLAKLFGARLGRRIKEVIIIDIPRLMRDKGYSSKQLDWFYNIIHKMFDDNRFLLGQIRMRKSLERISNDIASIDRDLESIKKNLDRARGVDETNINQHIVDNINKMQWIDNMSLTKQGLSILTKSMACTHVPNIARAVDVREIAKCDMLYRIMKYQYLGKYFIAMPDYYMIENNYNFRAEENNKYPLSPSRLVVQNATWFHGMICHAGNRNACLGELSGSISQADKTGLDIYLMSVEAYIRSINLSDIAGQRFYCLPMGDANGNIEVWPYVETFAKQQGVSMKNLERNLDGYNNFIRNSLGYDSLPQYGFRYIANSSEEVINQNEQNCLELIKIREPKVYEELVKRGVVAA